MARSGHNCAKCGAAIYSGQFCSMACYGKWQASVATADPRDVHWAYRRLEGQAVQRRLTQEDSGAENGGLAGHSGGSNEVRDSEHLDPENG